MSEVEPLAAFSVSDDGLGSLVALVATIVATFSAMGGSLLLRRTQKHEEEIEERLAASLTWDGVSKVEDGSGRPVVGTAPPTGPRDPSPQRGMDERQFKLMEQYHEQGLAQSQAGFWFSLVMASVGFLVIVVAFLTADEGVNLTRQGRSFLTLLSGAVVEAVASLFFVQSNRARRLMVQFFDRLRVDRKLFEALVLAEAVHDSQLRSNLQVMLALSLAEAKTSPAVLNAVYGRIVMDDEGSTDEDS